MYLLKCLLRYVVVFIFAYCLPNECMLVKFGLKVYIRWVLLFAAILQ